MFYVASGFRRIAPVFLDHPTHPDDLIISNLISHLIGKPLRTFAEKILRQKSQSELKGEDGDIFDIMGTPDKIESLWVLQNTDFVDASQYMVGLFLFLLLMLLKLSSSSPHTVDS